MMRAATLALCCLQAAAFHHAIQHRVRSPLAATTLDEAPPTEAPARTAAAPVLEAPARTAAAPVPAPAAEAPAETAASASIVAAMRTAAMALHSRPPPKAAAAAPAAGEKKPKGAPMMQVGAWSPPREAFVQYLVDSLHVYAEFERLILTRPLLAGALHGVGLSRHAQLEADLAALGVGGAADASATARGYALAVRDAVERGGAPAFACHYYNFYFAHTAGGKMIGRRMQDLFGLELGFYMDYPRGGVDECVARGKAALEELARGWTDDERAICTAETAVAFKGGGSLLKQIAVMGDDAGD